MISPGWVVEYEMRLVGAGEEIPVAAGAPLVVRVPITGLTKYIDHRVDIPADPVVWIDSAGCTEPPVAVDSGRELAPPALPAIAAWMPVIKANAHPATTACIHRLRLVGRPHPRIWALMALLPPTQHASDHWCPIARTDLTRVSQRRGAGLCFSRLDSWLTRYGRGQRHTSYR